MRASVMVIAVGSLIGLHGCAGKGAAQAINRLQADIGLLDQRVTQLERASLQQSAAGLSMEPETVVSIPQDSPAVRVSVATAPPSSLKPSKHEIQQALKHAGFYNGPIDGKIGPQTQEAIRQFQQVHGLKVDGVVGKQTWEKLAPYATLASSDGSELNAAETLK